MPTRAADDFETIRTRLEQLKKEREEADRAQPQEEPKADTYAEYDGCGYNNVYSLSAYREYIKALAKEFKL